MLLFFQEVMGKYPVKVGRKGEYWIRHFDKQGNFTENKKDPVTKLEIKIKHQFKDQPSENLQLLLDPHNLYKKKMIEIERKKFNNFRNLLQRMMNLDDYKRINPDNGLEHPF